jgi:hypothetical protein
MFDAMQHILSGQHQFASATRNVPHQSAAKFAVAVRGLS